MQPSIPRSSSHRNFCHRNDDYHPFFEVYGVVFIRSTTALTCRHSLPFVATLCHSFSLFVTRCHSLSLVVPLVFIRCHSFTTRCHSLSFVVTRCTTRCHSLSLDVPLVCLFINDQQYLKCLIQKRLKYKKIKPSKHIHAQS